MTDLQSVFDWADYVIVGSGIGAATFASHMGAHGHTVLVLEAGDWVKRDETDWNPEAMLIKERYRDETYFSNVIAHQYGDKQGKPLPVRAVVGGMSVFYGAAAFRMRKADVDRFPAPLNYQLFEPYYEQAESLLAVQGDDSQDPSAPPRRRPLAPPGELAVPAVRINKAGQRLGLSPSRIPLAIRASACQLCNTCDGFPCVVEAKQEGSTLLRAAGSNVRVLTRVFVERLTLEGSEVRSLELRQGSQVSTLQIRGRVILGAGALGSPAILLRSHATFGKLTAAPQFGRYLMRHANAVVGALFAPTINPGQVFAKQIVFSDLYESERATSGMAVGVIQDIYTPAARVMRHFAPKLVSVFAGLLSNHIQNLLCVAEDEPQAENRVYLDGDKIRVHSEYTAADLHRRDLLIAQAKKILKTAGGSFCQVMPISSYSHALGTLRMGTNPRESCTDTNGKIWEVKNLWCVDASVLPVSAGVNPSLTIVANTLRIAQNILKEDAGL